MRLKASFVVENAFIAPLFTLIIVALMSLCLYIRDSLIIENGILIASMKFEQEVRKKDETTDGANADSTEIVRAAESYIKDNVVVMKDIDAARIKKEMNKNPIKGNYPPDFIRVVNVAKKRI